MRRNIVTGLSTKELEQLGSEMNDWAEKIKKASINIVNDLAEYGSEKMQEIYQSAQNEYQDMSSMDFAITGSDTEKTVSMIGEQAIYDEFGTGTRGAESPHPIKSEFGLNEYNSGPTIRTAKTKINGIKPGDLYWTFKDEAGEIHYTQGVPAQKEGYDSFKATVKKAPEIIKKRMEETLK